MPSALVPSPEADEIGDSIYSEFSLHRPTELLRDVVALANTRGGHLILDVPPRRGDGQSFAGVSDELSSLSRIVSYIGVRTDPPVHVTAEYLDIDGLPSMIGINVPYGWNRPYAVLGETGVYVLQGDSPSPASSEDLRRLSLEARLSSFEDASVSGSVLDDIDPELVGTYLARRSGGTWDTNADAPGLEVVLRNLGFAVRSPAGKRDEMLPTVGGLLLFGRNPQRFLPHARIECARFAGIESGPDAERAFVEGTVLDQVSGATDFIFKHMRVAMRIESFQRHDLTEYPISVVRELLINALVHRDYSVPAPIRVEMFFDRWEITSPGRLLGGLTASILGRASERLTRNPRIADAARIFEYSEGLGIGLARISKKLEQAEYPPLEFHETPSGLKVVLAGAAEVRYRQERLRTYRQRLGYGSDSEPSPRLILALDHLLRNGSMTNADYRAITRVSDATALRDLNELVDRGFIERHGAKRGIHYTATIQAQKPRGIAP